VLLSTFGGLSLLWTHGFVLGLPIAAMFSQALHGVGAKVPPQPLDRERVVLPWGHLEENGMTMRDNDNRPRAGMRDGGFSWGIPAAIVVALLIIGGLFYMNSDGSRTTSASNNSPATSSSTTGPAGAQAPARSTTTTPAPATTPKQ
jgi:hypothetical protein